MAFVEQAVHLRRSQFQRVHTTGADADTVFLLELVHKRGLGDLGAAVATHFFGQFAAALFQRGQGLFVDQLDEVEAVIRADRTCDVAGVFHLKRCVLELLDHLSRSKPRQHSAFVGGRRVLAVLHGKRLERFSAEKQALHFLDAAFCVRHLILRGILRHAHHDVSHLDFPACLALARYLQNVVAKSRANHFTQLTFCRFEGRALKRVDHLKGRKPSQVPAVARHGGVVAAAFAAGDRFKVFPIGQARTQPLDAIPCTKGVGGRGVFVHAHEDVTGTHLHAFSLKSFFHQRVQQFAIHEIGACQLGAVPRKLFLERACSVHAQSFRLENLQFEIDEQLHVFVERFDRVHAVSVVFAVDVLKISQRHQFAAHFEDVTFLGSCVRGALALSKRRSNCS